MIKELIYKIIDLITFGKGLKRNFTNNSLRIPTRFFRYFPVGYEDENLQIINSKVTKGMCVIDVGAHIGLIAVILGKKVQAEGKVYAFEPTPVTFKLLEKTIRINHLENILIPVKA